jgi:hypothetical protein
MEDLLVEQLVAQLSDLLPTDRHGRHRRFVA